MRPTQSRGGVKGETSSLFLFPLAESRGSASGRVWGNAPTVPRQTYSKEEDKQSRASEASRAQTSRVLRRAPKLLFPASMLCRADGATELLVFQTWLLVSASRDFAPAGATRGLCVRPLDCFAYAISCYLPFSAAEAALLGRANIIKACAAFEKRGRESQMELTLPCLLHCAKWN